MNQLQLVQRLPFIETQPACCSCYTCTVTDTVHDIQTTQPLANVGPLPDTCIYLSVQSLPEVSDRQSVAVSTKPQNMPRNKFKNIIVCMSIGAHDYL